LLMYVMPTGVAGGAAKLRDALHRRRLPGPARNPLAEPVEAAGLPAAGGEKQSEGAH